MRRPWTGRNAATDGQDSPPAVRPRVRLLPAWLALPMLALVIFLGTILVTLRLDRPRLPQGYATRPVAAPSLEPVTEIVFKCSLLQLQNGLEKVIAEFEATNPDIVVKWEPFAIQGNNQVAWDESMKDAADTSEVYCAYATPAELENGAARDLTPFIENDLSFRPEDFYPKLLHRWNQGGAILSVPLHVQPVFIAYSPEAFDEAGLAHPRPGWTWDEFLQTASQLTKRKGDTVERWGYYELRPWLFANPLRAAWGSDFTEQPDYVSTAEMLRWYESAYGREGGIALPALLDWVPGQPLVDNLADMLRSGKMAMWEAGWAAEGGTPGPYNLVPLPEPSFMNAGYSQGLVLSGQTGYPSEAWRWISYLSQNLPESDLLPARRSQAEQAGFWKMLDPESAAAYRYQLDHMALNDFDDLPASYLSYQDAVVSVAKGQKTAEEALADLDAGVKLHGGPAAEDATVAPATRDPGH
jgi:ABC-type glycerol-3-phosphate transport system substrate-binding protein